MAAAALDAPRRVRLVCGACLLTALGAAFVFNLSLLQSSPRGRLTRYHTERDAVLAQNGSTVQWTNDRAGGWEKPRGKTGGAQAICCMALTAPCLACKAGQTVAQFCAARRNRAVLPSGCPRPAAAAAAASIEEFFLEGALEGAGGVVGAALEGCIKPPPSADSRLTPALSLCPRQRGQRPPPPPQGTDPPADLFSEPGLLFARLQTEHPMLVGDRANKAGALDLCCTGGGCRCGRRRCCCC